MPKVTYKKTKDVCRRYFNQLINKTTIQLFDGAVKKSSIKGEYIPGTSDLDHVSIPSCSTFPDTTNFADQSEKDYNFSVCSGTSDLDHVSIPSCSTFPDTTNVADQSEKDYNYSICSVQPDPKSSLRNSTFPDPPIISATNSISNCSSNYVGNIANWAVHYKIPHNAVNAFLKIQRKEPGYSTLPKDSRTLLNTPRCTIIREVNPGEYHHFGLIFAIQQYLKSLKSHKPTEINIYVGIDGLSISDSSPSQVWPILCTFRNNYRNTASSVFPIGIYHGKKEKPVCSNEFLQDFIDEAVKLIDAGFTDESTNIKIRISAIVCDAPAKSFVFKTKGHAGFYSCTRCTQKGQSKNNRLFFPEIDSPPRTHLSFCNQSQTEHHNGFTDLVKLPHFDLVKCVPLDYMHLICLGVVKKLLFMWLQQRKGDHRLPSHEVQLINTKLTDIRRYIPNDFSRKPRSLTEGSWKATEYRQFLLYSGPVVLKGIIPDNLYLNFLALSVATSIMLSETLYSVHLNFADSLMKWFVRDFSRLYGSQYISHNVHALTHLKDDVLQFGPLDNCSAFVFENYMSTIKSLLTRKPDKPLQQFARRYSEMMSNKSVENVTEDKPILKQEHSNGPLVSDKEYMVTQYNEISFSNLVLSANVGNNCCKLQDGSIIIVQNIVKDADASDIYLVGKECINLVDFYVKPCASSRLGVWFGKTLGPLRFWSVSLVLMKCIKLPFQDGFVVYPFLHSSPSDK